MSPVALEIYVSTEGNDSWSGRAPIPGNSGNGPFATIERARDEVRDLVAEGLKGDVVILIREGKYYLPGGLALGPKDSGTSAHSINGIFL
ncbi:MAG: hypothetical protein HXS50_02885 [Theionarchaea archaeon]|nr:hypothetical protein [Theionarchaea archaeon]